MDRFKTMTEETAKKMLNTLESIDVTLKRIEQNQNNAFKALIGEKYDSTPKDDGMSKNEVKDILCQQLQLLAEKSQGCQPTDSGFYPGLIDYSRVICGLADTYTHLSEFGE